MRPLYIFHSGFIVENRDCYYIFDYFRGRLPQLDSSKRAVVFASHAHHDHYEPLIFELLREQGIEDIRAVLSKDIFKKRYPQGIEVVRSLGGNEYALPGGERVETLFSTDVGVAYLLTTDEGVIYHGGDLNDWRWEGESDQYNRNMAANYRREIDKLRGRSIDLAFLPLDPRQEGYYAEGIRYFLDNVGAAQAYPMHYWEDPGIIRRFLREYPQYEGVVRYTEQPH